MAEPSAPLGPPAWVDGLLLVVQVSGKFVVADGNLQPGEPEVVVLTLVELVARVAALAHREGVGLPQALVKVSNVRLQETGARERPVLQSACASSCLQLEVAELGVQIARFVFDPFSPRRPIQYFWAQVWSLAL